MSVNKSVQSKTARCSLICSNKYFSGCLCIIISCQITVRIKQDLLVAQHLSALLLNILVVVRPSMYTYLQAKQTTWSCSLLQTTY